MMGGTECLEEGHVTHGERGGGGWGHELFSRGWTHADVQPALDHDPVEALPDLAHAQTEDDWIGQELEVREQVHKVDQGVAFYDVFLAGFESNDEEDGVRESTDAQGQQENHRSAKCSFLLLDLLIKTGIERLTAVDLDLVKDYETQDHCGDIESPDHRDDNVHGDCHYLDYTLLQKDRTVRVCLQEYHGQDRDAAHHKRTQPSTEDKYADFLRPVRRTGNHGLADGAVLHCGEAHHRPDAFNSEGSRDKNKDAEVEESLAIHLVEVRLDKIKAVIGQPGEYASDGVGRSQIVKQYPIDCAILLCPPSFSQEQKSSNVGKASDNSREGLNHHACQRVIRREELRTGIIVWRHP